MSKNILSAWDIKRNEVFCFFDGGLWKILTNYRIFIIDNYLNFWKFNKGYTNIILYVKLLLKLEYNQTIMLYFLFLNNLSVSYQLYKLRSSFGFFDRLFYSFKLMNIFNNSNGNFYLFYEFFGCNIFHIQASLIPFLFL